MLVWTVAGVALALFAATANAALITVDGTDNWISGNANLGGTFDASGSDKLVFIATGEHGFNQTGNGWAGDVFYDGVQLTPAVKRQPIKANAGLGILVDDTYNALYYLDSPGSVHTAGVITTSGFSARGSVAVLALSNTLPGVGDTVVGARDTNTADLTTSTGSIVIGSYGMGGTGNTANPNTVTTPQWDSEVVRQGNGGGRYWDGHVVAYQNNVSAGTRSYTFNDTYGPESDGRTGRHVIAAEFLADSWLKGELGILDVSGTNPATGEPWKYGDTYRLAFITSESTTATSADIDDYNAFVQGLADDAGLGGTWKAIGSTSDVDARDNTSTNPTVETGSPILLVDGSTVIATDNADLWDGEIQNIINLTEDGDVFTHWPFTGTHLDGTKAPGHGASFGALGDGGQIHQGRSDITTEWIWRMWTGASSTSELRMYAMSTPLSVVPEPSSAMLMFLGVIGLLMVRRKR